ncbi:DUF459 domain-containing protein [Enterobacter hormaechei]|uniref:SGNH/GDSL hydrolase family protein n=1 Tax=Enterobacteriaceae TaxID=543 RepID=UPI001CC36F19|nr:DUF459 domain-containing protein [Citrobacter braakii]
MQISDYADIINKTLKSSLIIFTSMLGLIWLNQQSLNQYWALHFHRESPWASVTSPVWLTGAKVMSAAEVAKGTFIAQLTGSALMPTPASLNTPADLLVSADVAADTPVDERQLGKWISTRRPSFIYELQANSGFEVASHLYDEEGKALLPSGRKVLMVGDSMMEGVAPRVLKILHDDYQASGIDLSKRSTGLAYPGFFDWPATVKKALMGNADIGLIAVFLGPNDPWDMPVKNSRTYLRFGSEPWDEEYRSRIRQILELGNQYNIPVIWILPPNMQKAKLNKGMAILNRLYESEVKQVGGVVISVNTLFGYQADLYASSAMINGKLKRVRASDGIHYTPAGAQLIASKIVEQIHFVSPASEELYEK